MNSFAVERFFCHTSRVCWLFWVWASWYSLFERKSRFEGNCHNMTRNRLNMAQPSTLTINQYLKVAQLQCHFYVKIPIFSLPSFTTLHFRLWRSRNGFGEHSPMWPPKARPLRAMKTNTKEHRQKDRLENTFESKRYIYIWYMICYNIHGCRKNTIDVWWYLKYMKGWNKYVDNVESHMKNHSNRNWNPYNSLFIVVCFFHSFVKPRRKGDIVTYEHGVCFSQ